MAVTTYLAEGIPAAYPDAPTGLSAAAAALDPDFIWQRIEAFIAYRWSVREASFIVEGPGPWKPNLVPTTITTAEKWVNEQWEAVTLTADPLGGFELDSEGPFRFTGTAGDGVGFLVTLNIATHGLIRASGGTKAPAAAEEAFRRLAEYLASEDPGPAGATAASYEVGPVKISHDRAASWIAKAMQNSGAADLLRQYRRAP